MFPLFLHSTTSPNINIPTRVVRLLQSMNLHWHLIIRNPWLALGMTLGGVHSWHHELFSLKIMVVKLKYISGISLHKEIMVGFLLRINI